MTRICGILTLAVGMSIAGCNSDGGMWRADADRQPDRAFNNQATGTVRQNNLNDTNNMNNTQVRDDSAGQLTRQADKTPANNLSTPDRNFVTDAAAGGMFEMQSAMAAMTKASDARIKTVATKLEADHTKANLQLKNLALSKGFAIDTVGLTNDQRTMLDSLNKLSGSEFDREYLRQQKVAHEETIAKFQRASSTADDKDLRDWATNTLPTLRDHLSMLNIDQPNIGSDR